MTQPSLFNELRGARFSQCRRYRYTLSRQWGQGGVWVNFLMLNPSTADATVNDPTITRCIRRAQGMGAGGLIVTNLFAWRATDPDDMKRAGDDAVGPENDQWILNAANISSQVICAWGNHGRHLDRSAAVLKILEPHKHKLFALNVTQAREPQHPLYVSLKKIPQPFPPVEKGST